MSDPAKLKYAGFNTQQARISGYGFTGEIKWGMFNSALSAPDGWIWLNGATIGQIGSGATHTQQGIVDLYVHLWTVCADAECAVSTGRGASALADFIAGKTLTIPNAVGKMPIHKAATGTGSTLGKTGGAIDHTHTAPGHYHGLGTGADLAVDINHDHGAKTSAAGGSHTHAMPFNSNQAATTGYYAASGTGFVAVQGSSPANVGNESSHTHSVDLDALGATSKTPSGRIGLVTGGVDGNAAMTSGTNNPPFITMVAMIAL